MSSSDWTPERIRALRMRLGMTQVQMAARLGYATQPAYARLESGERSPSGPVSRLLDMVAVQAEEREHE